MTYFSLFKNFTNLTLKFSFSIDLPNHLHSSTWPSERTSKWWGLSSCPPPLHQLFSNLKAKIFNQSSKFDWPDLFVEGWEWFRRSGWEWFRIPSADLSSLNIFCTIHVIFSDSKLNKNAMLIIRMSKILIPPSIL